MAPQALKKAANHEKRKRNVSSMFRRISSMNCHNILECIVASSLCSAAAASSLSICSLCSSSLCIIKLPAADHQTIKLHCFCISSNCLQLCMRLSRYMSAAKHHDIKLHVSLQQIIEMQTAYLQQIKKTAKNKLQLIIKLPAADHQKQSSCIAAACHPTVCSCA